METGLIKIGLDKTWELKDFSIFSKEYVHLYNFFYVLKLTNQNERRSLDFSTYPWEGGYSVTNFFRKLNACTRKEHRLKISRLEYSSPGIMELSGVISVARDISLLIGIVCGSLVAINTTYHKIYMSYIRRKLARVDIKKAEVELSSHDRAFITESVSELNYQLGMQEMHIKALKRISNNNELIQLKILLTIFRRMKFIAENQEQGKTKV